MKEKTNKVLKDIELDPLTSSQNVLVMVIVEAETETREAKECQEGEYDLL